MGIKKRDGIGRKEVNNLDGVFFLSKFVKKEYKTETSPHGERGRDMTSHKQAGHINKLTRTILALLLIMLCNTVDAQLLKETRVYYLDITGSMKPIWDNVTGNLKKAIDNVNDETATLEVVAWTDSRHELRRKKVKATDSGKSELKNFIDGITLIEDTYTEVFVPFEDFYKNYGASKDETYFYLMTDGATYSKTTSKLDSAIDSWRNLTNSTCYGFYVMLTDEAAAGNIKNKVAAQDAQLWTVETADVNIKHVKLERRPIYDVRNSETFDVGISGDYGGASISLTGSDQYYSIASQKVVSTSDGGKAIRVTVKKSTTDLPTDHQWRIGVNAVGLPQFTFLISKTINVMCVNKPYPTVKISFKD